MAQLIIDNREIEIHLASELDLQLDYHKAPQADVIENEIEVIIQPPTSRWYWLPKNEALAKF